LRLSADLHDGIAPDLSTIKLYLDTLHYYYNTPETHKIIEKANEIITQTIINLKQVSKSLCNSIIKDFGIEKKKRHLSMIWHLVRLKLFLIQIWHQIGILMLLRCQFILLLKN